jgi:hypothetical protein
MAPVFVHNDADRDAMVLNVCPSHALKLYIKQCGIKSSLQTPDLNVLHFGETFQRAAIADFIQEGR